MPFLSYQISVEEGVRNAGRFLKEGGAHAVKLEGPQVELTQRLVELGIPVMAHVGLTPQSVHGLGGYRVQGRGEDSGRLIDEAQALEKAGAFAIVLEGVPTDLGAEITQMLEIPTIGIGAGPGTDAQVLVVHDLLGLSERLPRFAKPYADLRRVIADAARAFASDVEAGTFPDAEHSYPRLRPRRRRRDGLDSERGIDAVVPRRRARRRGGDRRRARGRPRDRRGQRPDAPRGRRRGPAGIGRLRRRLGAHAAARGRRIPSSSGPRPPRSSRTS